MRTPREIYKQYNLMPLLQLHQLRVAAVGKVICDNFNPPTGAPLHTEHVILTGLFHDMGNIIKSDVSLFPEYQDSKQVEHWQKIKDDYIARYGTEHHSATNKIAEELSLPQKVREYISNIEFARLEDVRDGASFEQKICEYADLRVGPHGVLSMADRVAEARERFLKRFPEKKIDIHSDHLFTAAEEVERQIFAHSKIAPPYIHDATINPIVETLWDYPVPIS